MTYVSTSNPFLTSSSVCIHDDRLSTNSDLYSRVYLKLESPSNYAA